MKGKIEILFPGDRTIVIKGDYDKFDDADAVIIFDRLAQALELTQNDRLLIGVVIAGGGISALGGPPTKSIRIASDLLDIVEKIKGEAFSSDSLD